MTIARTLLLVIGLFSFPASADSRELDSMRRVIENVLQGRLTDADYRLQSLFLPLRGRALVPYLEVGCSRFNFVAEADGLEAAIEAVAEVKTLLRSTEA